MNTREKFKAAGKNVVYFVKTIHSNGKRLLKRSSEEGRKFRDEVIAKSLDMLKRTPGIRGILQSSKDIEETRKARNESLRYERMKVIRANNFRDGMDL